MLRARAELDSRPAPALIRLRFIVPILSRESSLMQFKDRVLSFVLRAEVFPVIVPVDLEFFVRVDAAAVIGRPGRVLPLNLDQNLSFHPACNLESLHCLEGNEGRREHLIKSFYTHFRLWSAFLFINFHRKHPYISKNTSINRFFTN